MVLEQKYFKIDYCIYCGVKDIPLTDEHIIPLGLNGKTMLKNASCEECRRITSKYERNPLHEIFLNARACLNYSSRKTNFKTKKYPQKVILLDGSETTINLTVEENLAITPFLIHSLPGFFGIEEYKGGSQIKGIAVYNLSKVLTDDLIKKYRIKSFQGKLEYKGINFENMIARIAYCYLIACFGPKCLKVNFILETILGKNENIGFWQGCDIEQIFIPQIGIIQASNAMQVTRLFRQETNSYVLAVSVKFFASFNVPEYIVIVGEPIDEISELFINDISKTTTN